MRERQDTDTGRAWTHCGGSEEALATELRRSVEERVSFHY